MQTIKEYNLWCSLPDLHKEKEFIKWNTYEGEGKELLEKTVEDLRNKYNRNRFILEISGGIYHGGFWVINVTNKKGSKIRLPKKYNGFPVFKMDVER